MKASEIREKDTATILAEVDGMRKELFNLKLGFTTGSVDNPHIIKQKRKDIARMLTILREREIAAEIAEEESNNG